MMLVLVTYDVSTIDKAGQKRLRQTAKICLNYGQRVQNSVFECWLSNDNFVKLKKQLLDTISQKEDSIRFYFIGSNWEYKVEHFGIKPSFNMDDPIVGKNKKLRQALAYSMDNKRYVEIFYAGIAPVATQLQPAGILGHDRDRPARYPFDLEKAKQMLAEAGYPGGRDKDGRQLELTLTEQGAGSEERQRAEFDQRCFEQLGIKVKVNAVTFARMQDIEDNGDFQIAGSAGWGADYPDPENYFMLFYSKNVSPVGKNYVRFRNAEFDRIYEQMVVADNGPARLEMVRKLQDILDEECPMFPTFHKAQYLSVQPWAPLTHNNLMYEVDGGHKYLVTDTLKRERLQREWNKPALWPAFLLAGAAIAALLGLIRAVRRSDKQTS